MTDRAAPTRPVTVVIATRNRPEMLRAVVESVLGGTVLPTEIVIVDQSDKAARCPPLDGTVGPCTIRHLRPEWVGLSRANNLGAAQASNDVILFTHDDVLVDTRWVETLADATQLAGPRVVITGRVAATAPETHRGFAPALRDDARPASHRGRVGHDVLKPMNFGIARSLFVEVDGFDPCLGPGTEFPGAEDSDLGFRLLEAGCTIEYVPQAIVRHRAWRERSTYLPLRWSYGVAQGAFYAKHSSRRDTHMMRRATRDVLRRVRSSPARLLQDPMLVAGDLVFVLATFVGAFRWWRTKNGAAA